ncbi:hypothetical protein CYMTET_17334 [Cymbomonas tetramitiformis]|uniref:Uncharacterized protein n=1 Tax=Cymbomonas tetramitiformis TaxID=36881 RepID=A0AAE0GAL1_9CHLO|nr:hypothetical protein CYMTET_17334 [Cymbomonas tetramitiformis]
MHGSCGTRGLYFRGYGGPGWSDSPECELRQDRPVLGCRVSTAKGAVLPAGAQGSSIIIWDGGSGQVTNKLGAHQGHITAIEWVTAGVAGEALLLTGGQDGYLRAWDPRQKQCAMEQALHVVQGKGSGAVGTIRSCSASGTVVTAGADCRIQVTDPRMGLQPRHTFTEHKDFIYSLEVSGGLCFSGAGDGMLLVHRLADGKLLYGLGANEHAVRCIGVAENHLVTSGDDGNAISYSF